MEEQFKDITNIVKEAGLHNPSSSFSKNVMNKIEMMASVEPVTYTPLISKKTWFGLALLMIILIIGIFFFPEGDKSILDAVDFSFLKFKGASVTNPFSKITLYKTTLYGVLFLAALFFIQIPILKRRIDQSFSA